MVVHPLIATRATSKWSKGAWLRTGLPNPHVPRRRARNRLLTGPLPSQGALGRQNPALLEIDEDVCNRT